MARDCILPQGGTKTMSREPHSSVGSEDQEDGHPHLLEVWSQDSTWRRQLRRNLLIRRIGWTAKRFLLSPVRLLKFLRRLAIRAVILSVVLVYVAFVFIHLTHDFALGESLYMTIADTRVAATCPHNPSTVLRFIDRDSIDAAAMNLAASNGIDVFTEACRGDTLASRIQGIFN